MATESETIERTRDHVRHLMQADTSGHDWWHVHRVWQMARRIAAREGGDSFVIELAALLHDVDDWKFAGGDETAASRSARDWLTSFDVGDTVLDHVCEIIAGVTYKGAGVATPMRTLEGRIVQDADRLDAIGALGIARTFAYGGHVGQPLHDPQQPATWHQDFEQYKRERSTTINHFHEKLLLLESRMQTQTAGRIATARHEYMCRFLEQFQREWDGDDCPGPPPQ